MSQQEILREIKNIIAEKFSNETTGHDYFHIERVVRNAKKIATAEKADLFMVELSAWLHDVGDKKLNGGIDKSKEQITAILERLNVEPTITDKVIEIVSQVSFSKGLSTTSIEAQIVQDSDRLDAIGAIGVARCFAFGGSAGNEIYHPQKKEGTSIQHFYDKLLRLKDLLHTDGAKQLAEERHQFMLDFLDQFHKERNE